MQKGSFQSGNTFSYIPAISIRPGAQIPCPARAFLKKAREEVPAGSAVLGEIIGNFGKRTQTFFPNQAITTIINKECAAPVLLRVRHGATTGSAGTLHWK